MVSAFHNWYQILKLKQLTVLTLAETYKVLLYGQLMQELDVPNVRELEDFLINECMYAESVDIFCFLSFVSIGGAFMNIEETTP
ncbi:COP9 signalosome complex subunit [Trifolium repens]|nr:COP9 signalosome complex subunit [Trifolium repens]